MIDRREIMEFSREFGLTPNVIEKDYALGWLLAGINNHSKISNEWVFKGGTQFPGTPYLFIDLLVTVKVRGG